MCVCEHGGVHACMRMCVCGRVGVWACRCVLACACDDARVHVHVFMCLPPTPSTKSVKDSQQPHISGDDTSLATGPHLHYEFYVNGAVRNPVTVKLPKALPIAAAEKPLFFAQMQKYMMQLASYTQKVYPITQIALANEQ